MANEKSIIRKVKNKENPYVMISKSVLEDERLSWKAKGLLAYLLSRPDDWQIIVGDLINRSKDGRESVLNGLKELITYGYLKREQEHGDRGRFTPVVYAVFEEPTLEESTNSPQSENPFTDDSPQSGFPYTVNPLTEKPYTENPQLLNNNLTKERYLIKNKNNNNNTLEGNENISKDQPQKNQNVVVDDKIFKLFLRYGITVNVDTIKYWRTLAEEGIILKVCEDAINRRDIKNIGGYITATLSKYNKSTPSIGNEKTEVVKNEINNSIYQQTRQQDKYNVFYDLYKQKESDKSKSGGFEYELLDGSY